MDTNRGNGKDRKCKKLMSDPTRGLQQGCNLSPLLFNLLMIDRATKIHHSGKGCPCRMTMFSEACFADDIGVVSTTMDGLASLLSIVVEKGMGMGMATSNIHKLQTIDVT